MSKFFKTLFLIYLTVLIFVSCSSKENPKGIESYAGVWYDKDNPIDEIFTINSDGSIIFKDNKETKIKEITKNNDVSYSFYYGMENINSSGTPINVRVKLTVNFSSYTSYIEGKLTAIGEGKLTNGDTINIPFPQLEFNIIKK